MNFHFCPTCSCIKPSHNIPALTLLAGPPSLMSTLGCSTSCLALPPGHSSIKSDPRTTPSLISFLADSFSSQSTHSHSLSGEEQLAQQLWTWASYTAAWTQHLLQGKEFGKGQTRCPDLPSWTSSQTLSLSCLMLPNGSGSDPWPDPVGPQPLLRVQLMLWVFSSSSLPTPVMEPPALVVPWLLCHELGVYSALEHTWLQESLRPTLCQHLLHLPSFLSTEEKDISAPVNYSLGLKEWFSVIRRIFLSSQMRHL